jgi:hypothetical protein
MLVLYSLYLIYVKCNFPVYGLFSAADLIENTERYEMCLVVLPVFTVYTAVKLMFCGI